MRNWFWALCLVLLLAGCDRDKLGEHDAVTDLSNAVYAREFSLTDQNGKPRTLADFRGKVVVLFFGYTHCPDVCPTTMSDLATAIKRLGADGSKVQVLFVTIDPERDTPEVLKKYVPFFGQSFLGLYGDADATARTAREFHATYEKVQVEENARNYAMDHTAGSYVFDQNGKIRFLMEYGISPDKITSTLKKLL